MLNQSQGTRVYVKLRRSLVVGTLMSHAAAVGTKMLGGTEAERGSSSVKAVQARSLLLGDLEGIWRRFHARDVIATAEGYAVVGGNGSGVELFS